MKLLPSNEPVELIEDDKKVRVLVYGKPMVGKTTFAATFPNTFFLSTDGNVKHLSTPRVIIKDPMEVTLDSGAKTQITAWQYFQNVITELEQDDTFETVVVDLVSDIYEFAKTAILTPLGATTESDLPMGQGWALVRNEFLRVMKRILKLDKNVVLIAHSVETGGVIKTNLTEKAFNGLTGYVDMSTFLEQETLEGEVIRVLYTVTLPGAGESGNRLDIKNSKILATYDSLMSEIKGDK